LEQLPVACVSRHCDGLATVEGQHSVFLDRNAILVEPEFNAGRLRFLAIEVDAQNYDGDNQAANDQVQGIVLLHEGSNPAFL
jgi:hypothetical protein